MSECKELIDAGIGVLNIFVTAGAAFLGAVLAYYFQKKIRTEETATLYVSLCSSAKEEAAMLLSEVKKIKDGAIKNIELLSQSSSEASLSIVQLDSDPLKSLKDQISLIKPTSPLGVILRRSIRDIRYLDAIHHHAYQPLRSGESSTQGLLTDLKTQADVVTKTLQELQESGISELAKFKSD